MQILYVNFFKKVNKSKTDRLFFLNKQNEMIMWTCNHVDLVTCALVF